VWHKVKTLAREKTAQTQSAPPRVATPPSLPTKPPPLLEIGRANSSISTTLLTASPEHHGRCMRQLLASNLTPTLRNPFGSFGVVCCVHLLRVVQRLQIKSVIVYEEGLRGAKRVCLRGLGFLMGRDHFCH
jgi:hypothetical protein